MEFRYTEINGNRISVALGKDNFTDSLRVGYQRENKCIVIDPKCTAHAIPLPNRVLVVFDELQTMNLPVKNDCLDCKYFSGDRHLKCAVNPTRKPEENCPDFAEKQNEAN